MDVASSALEAPARAAFTVAASRGEERAAQPEIVKPLFTFRNLSVVRQVLTRLLPKMSHFLSYNGSFLDSASQEG
jgi:hypothetical protein